MKQELFNNKTKAEDYQRQPKQLGLYEASHEHDACETLKHSCERVSLAGRRLLPLLSFLVSS